MSVGEMLRRAVFFLMASMTTRGEREDSTPSRTRLGEAEGEAGEEGIQEPNPMNGTGGNLSRTSQSEVTDENWAR